MSNETFYYASSYIRNLFFVFLIHRKHYDLNHQNWIIRVVIHWRAPMSPDMESITHHDHVDEEQSSSYYIMLVRRNGKRFRRKLMIITRKQITIFTKHAPIRRFQSPVVHSLHWRVECSCLWTVLNTSGRGGEGQTSRSMPYMRKSPYYVRCSICLRAGRSFKTPDAISTVAAVIRSDTGGIKNKIYVRQ